MNLRRKASAAAAAGTLASDVGPGTFPLRVAQR